MSDILSLATATRQARANQWPARLGGGSLTIYDGTAPATPDTAITFQSALVTFAIPDPAGAAAAGTFTGDDLDPALCLASGNATWARSYDSLGDPVADWPVGLDGSGTAVEIDNLSLVSGSYATITSWGVIE